MMEAVAGAIVDRLTEKMPAFTVEHFPDAPQRYDFSAATNKLLVSYEQSTYGEELSNEPSSLDRAAEFAVTVLVRSLRGPEGVQATIENVRRALHGWRAPQGGTRFVPTRDALVGEEDGVWRFVVNFKATFPAVAEAEEEGGPPLQTVSTETEITKRNPL